ncbi:MAG TPA: hypothetical protein VKA49_04905 [Flavitalea sp.]|nr:hypothetical protein [Flavitalea sp.]
METIPLYVSVILALTTVLTGWLFYKASRYSKTVLIILLAWLFIQAVVGLTGFYQDTSVLPPRFLLAIGPPMLLIVLLFLTRRGRQFIDSLNLETLTFLHIIRIPVEIVLYFLFLHKGIPEVMTFEGRNLDIISGITAPVIYYLGFVSGKLWPRTILAWNLICLALLVNIVTTAILATPYPFQKFGLDQPNVAIFYFPFVWLPAMIVPVVLLSHLASIRKLIGKKKAVGDIEMAAS